jgi:hypothetical protein
VCSGDNSRLLVLGEQIKKEFRDQWHRTWDGIRKIKVVLSSAHRSENITLPVPGGVYELTPTLYYLLKSTN